MENLVMQQQLAEFYKDKKVFVTGHTGFKGAWLITWLHQLGATVVGYSLAPNDEHGLFSIVKDRLAFEHILGDVRDKHHLEQAIATFQPDIIFHLAAQALVRLSYQLPSETFEVNVIGTANVLESVTRLPGKCTVVVITTDKVYENREIDYLYNEADVLGGYDPYSASKAATEMVVASFRNSFFHPAKIAHHQKAIVSARAGNVIGGGDWSKDRIIPDIVRSLKSAQSIFVRNPHAVRPWQHVLEPLSGYLVAAMKADTTPAVFGGAYNFGPLPHDHLTVQELVETAIDCWGTGDWVNGYDAGQPHEAGLLKLSIEKAQQQLHWQPKLNSKEAIQFTIDWYRQPLETVFDFTLSQLQKYQAQ